MTIWRFPKIEVPPVLIHFNGIWHAQTPSIFRGSPTYGSFPLFLTMETRLARLVRRATAIKQFVIRFLQALFLRAMRMCSWPVCWWCRQVRNGNVPRRMCWVFKYVYDEDWWSTGIYVIQYKDQRFWKVRRRKNVAWNGSLVLHLPVWGISGFVCFVVNSTTNLRERCFSNTIH